MENQLKEVYEINIADSKKLLELAEKTNDKELAEKAKEQIKKYSDKLQKLN